MANDLSIVFNPTTPTDLLRSFTNPPPPIDIPFVSGLIIFINVFESVLFDINDNEVPVPAELLL